MVNSSYHANDSQIPVDGPEVSVTVDGFIDRSYPNITFNFTNGVSLTPSVQYCTPPSCRPLTLDLYQPKSEFSGYGAQWPILIFVHGGSWARGDNRSSRPLRNFPEVLASIAATGFVVASVEYRLVGDALWPAQGQDVVAAVRYLRANASAFGANPEKIAAWGVSCGAHLVAVAATSHGEPFLVSPDPVLAHIDGSLQAAVCWYGGYDMETIEQHCEESGALSRRDPTMPEWKLLGGKVNELTSDYVRSAGPVNFVSKKTPPMFLVAGNSDKIIPALQTKQMANRLAQFDVPYELMLIPDVGHDLAGQNGEETKAANQAALSKSLAFLCRIFD